MPVPCNARAMPMHMQELLELYDKIGHTKKMGIVYTASTITDVGVGLQAEQQGVCVGWRICKVCRMVHCTPLCMIAFVLYPYSICIASLSGQRMPNMPADPLLRVTFLSNRAVVQIVFREHLGACRRRMPRSCG